MTMEVTIENAQASWAGTQISPFNQQSLSYYQGAGVGLRPRHVSPTLRRRRRLENAFSPKPSNVL